MKTAFFIVVVLGCLLSVWLAPAVPAAGEPLLERLDQRIRATPSAKAEPGYLGVTVDDRQDRGRGVRITAIRPDGPGAKAGLRTGDLITVVATVPVRQLTDMADVLDGLKPGDSPVIEVLRDNKPQQVKVTLGRRPASAPQQGTVQRPSTSPPAAEPPATTPLVDLVPATPLSEPTPPPPAPGEAAPAAPSSSEPPAVPGPALGAPDAAAAPASDADRIARLVKRIEELERRVAELERALATSEKKP